MNDDSPRPPAGWYPTPTGDQRYWDGERWLELPPPETKTDTAVDGTDAPAPSPKGRTKRWLVAGVIAALVVAGTAGGIVLKSSSDARAASEAEAAAAQVAQDKEDADAQAAAAAKASQRKRDDAERASRKLTVTEIEASVMAMAEKHAADGAVDGPIISATCSPLGGGSTDDLTASTTVFTCFVANKDNGDGTMSGYDYHSTMNWTTGSYTYGLGSPN